MKLKYKEILKAFTSLPYIILRKKYLIPQAPMPPKDRSLHTKTPLYDIMLTDFPHLVDEQLISLKQNNQLDQIKTIYQQEINKRKEEYRRERKKYQETYLEPLKIFARGLRPEFFYYRDHKDEVIKNGAYKSFAKLYELYRTVDEDTKRKYEEICNGESTKMMKRLAEAEAKYKIPEKRFEHPYLIYVKEKFQGKIDPNKFKLYTVLPEEQKLIYLERSRELKEQDRKALLAFLEAKKLNMEQFRYIKKICENVKEIRAKLKKGQISKKELQKQSDNDESDEEWF